MSKAKPCPKVVGRDRGVNDLCGRPKMKGKQSCEWHWLLRQSSDVQADHARMRLAEARTKGEHASRIPKDLWPKGTRWCAGCQTFVPLFYVTGSRCKACASVAAHATRTEKVYGISPDEYHRIQQIQNDRCAICRNRPRTIRLAVDHDHKTGEVRGLLCKRCNHELLGAAHDSVAMLWRAIEYLLFPPAQQHEDCTYRMPGEVVAALRAHLEQKQAEAQRPAVEPETPPF